jgi:hypothetical protein
MPSDPRFHVAPNFDVGALTQTRVCSSCTDRFILLVPVRTVSVILHITFCYSILVKIDFTTDETLEAAGAVISTNKSIGKSLVDR